MLKNFTAFLGALLLLSGTAMAQMTLPRLNKENPKEWGEPIDISITSDKFTKKGVEPVPMKVQVRFVKKIALGCQYEYKVTNASTTQAVYCDEMYAVNDQKYSEKFKPGESKIFLANTMRRCGDKKAKGDEPCMDCESSFIFTKVEPK